MCDAKGKRRKFHGSSLAILEYARLELSDKKSGHKRTAIRFSATKTTESCGKCRNTLDALWEKETSIPSTAAPVIEDVENQEDYSTTKDDPSVFYNYSCCGAWAQGHGLCHGCHRPNSPCSGFHAPYPPQAYPYLPPGHHRPAFYPPTLSHQQPPFQLRQPAPMRFPPAPPTEAPPLLDWSAYVPGRPPWEVRRRTYSQREMDGGTSAPSSFAPGSGVAYPYPPPTPRFDEESRQISNDEYPVAEPGSNRTSWSDDLESNYAQTLHTTAPNDSSSPPSGGEDEDPVAVVPAEALQRELEEMSIAKLRRLSRQSRIGKGKFQLPPNIPSRDLRFAVTIGSGTFGIVKKAKLVGQDGRSRSVAVKIMASGGSFREFRQEAKLLKASSPHPNIVECIGFGGADVQRPFLVLELASCSLLSLLRSYARNGTPLNKAYVDFQWMAPEALDPGRFSTKSDAWSIGVLFWEVETGGESPYPGMGKRPRLSSLMSFLNSGQRLARPPSTPDILWRMIESCWNMEPAQRPDFRDIQHLLERLL